MDYPSYTNKQLLTKLKDGDREAYKYIYMTYYKDLCVYLRSYTDSQTAEDIIQNILLNLWEKREKTNIHTSIKSYLYKSAYYTYIDFYRKKKRINEKLESLRHNVLNEIIENDNQVKEHRIIALRNAIEELPPKCKEVFVMSKFEGLKYSEIAETLGISTYTVEGQIGKAFKIIRKKVIGIKYINLFINFLKRKRSYPEFCASE